jgi:hypothetical protein
MPGTLMSLAKTARPVTLSRCSLLAFRFVNGPSFGGGNRYALAEAGVVSA